VPFRRLVATRDRSHGPLLPSRCGVSDGQYEGRSAASRVNVREVLLRSRDVRFVGYRAGFDEGADPRAEGRRSPSRFFTRINARPSLGGVML